MQHDKISTLSKDENQNSLERSARMETEDVDNCNHVRTSGVPNHMRHTVWCNHLYRTLTSFGHGPDDAGHDADQP